MNDCSQPRELWLNHRCWKFALLYVYSITMQWLWVCSSWWWSVRTMCERPRDRAGGSLYKWGHNLIYGQYWVSPTPTPTWVKGWSQPSFTTYPTPPPSPHTFSYRKIAGDVCTGGVESLYAPFKAQCCDGSTEPPAQSNANSYSVIHVYRYVT